MEHTECGVSMTTTIKKMAFSRPSFLFIFFLKSRPVKQIDVVPVELPSEKLQISTSSNL